MSFMDVIKKSVLEQFPAGSSATVTGMMLSLLAAFVMGAFILLIYKATFRGVLFSKGYAFSLVLLRQNQRYDPLSVLFHFCSLLFPSAVLFVLSKVNCTYKPFTVKLYYNKNKKDINHRLTLFVLPQKKCRRASPAGLLCGRQNREKPPVRWGKVHRTDVLYGFSIRFRNQLA